MLVDLSVKDLTLSKSITFLTLLEYNFILGVNVYIRFVPHPLYILLSTRNKGGGGVPTYPETHPRPAGGFLLAVNVEGY